MRIGTISMGALLAMTAGVFAQATQNTTNVLNAAKASGDAESAKVAREQGSDGAAFNQLAQQAQRALGQPQNSAEQEKLAADGRKLEETLKTLSPEAQKLLAQSTAAPVMRAPDPDSAVKALPVAPAAQDGKPKVPAGAADKNAVPGEAPPVKKDNDVHITSQGVAYFDSANAIGVFTDDVEVIHPQFHLYCEQLEIYMLKDNEKKAQEEKQAAATKAAGTAPAPSTGPAVIPGALVTSTAAARASNPDATAPAGSASNPQAPGAPPAKEAQPDNSIRQAIARGPKVVIIKNTETGENQIGVCRNATYVGENGDIILRDMPLVERGNHVHYATDPSTYMIIKQDGKLDTRGPAKTDIIEEKEKKAAPPGAPAAAAPTPAPPGPAKPAKPPGPTPKKGKL